MATEIERKFLTRSDVWKHLAPPVLYRQGYMNSDRGHEVIVKTIAAPGRTSGFIEIRSAQLMEPIEFLIPIQEAIALQDELCFAHSEQTYNGTTEKVGHLSTQVGHTLRFRLAGTQGIFTIKAKTIGISRAEFEFELAAITAEYLLNRLCEQPQIEKTRRKIPHQGFIWEVDEFLGDNHGLIVAEIELNHENQSFTKPDWIGLEVTGDKRYNNSKLAKNPYNGWSDVPRSKVSRRKITQLT
jgi:adenylate cyclase